MLQDGGLGVGNSTNSTNLTNSKLFQPNSYLT